MQTLEPPRPLTLGEPDTSGGRNSNMRCLAQELSRLFWSHSGDQTMLTIWLSQLIINIRPGKEDSAHNSATLPIFEQYLATLFGCETDNVWEEADKWVASLYEGSRLQDVSSASA